MKKTITTLATAAVLAGALTLNIPTQAAQAAPAPQATQQEGSLRTGRLVTPPEASPEEAASQKERTSSTRYSPIHPAVNTLKVSRKTTDIRVDKEKEKVFFKGKEVRTCDQLIRLWAPPHMPKTSLKKDLTVQCFPSDLMMGADGLTWVSQIKRSGMWFYNGSLAVELNRDESPYRLLKVYYHEAYHARSTNWLWSSQRAYLKNVGQSTWENPFKKAKEAGEYIDPYAYYLADPQERFAWASTSCNLPYYENNTWAQQLIPGGCKKVKQFSNYK